MDRTILRLRKKLIYKSSTFDYKNIVLYEITKEDEVIANLEIKSSYTAELLYGLKTFHIKPIVRFFTISKSEILTDDNLKIGEILLPGWVWKKRKIVISTHNGQEVWEFSRTKSGLFTNKRSVIDTTLRMQDEVISYKIRLLEYLAPDTKNDCLRQVDGEISFTEYNEFVSILGIYPNELLILDQMGD